MKKLFFLLFTFGILFSCSKNETVNESNLDSVRENRIEINFNKLTAEVKSFVKTLSPEQLAIYSEQDITSDQLQNLGFEFELIQDLEAEIQQDLLNLSYASDQEAMDFLLQELTTTVTINNAAGTPCYNAWLGSMTAATAGLAACVIDSGGTATAGCAGGFLIATILIEASYQSCMGENYQ